MATRNKSEVPLIWCVSIHVLGAFEYYHLVKNQILCKGEIASARLQHRRYMIVQKYQFLFYCNLFIQWDYTGVM